MVELLNFLSEKGGRVAEVVHGWTVSCPECLNSVASITVLHHVRSWSMYSTRTRLIIGRTAISDVRPNIAILYKSLTLYLHNGRSYDPRT